MSDDLADVIFTAAAGAGGYFAVQFLVNPLLRYRRLRRVVHAELIYYADAVTLSREQSTATADPYAERVRQRKDRNRKHAASLLAAFRDLPAWYRRLLKCCGEDPEAASSELIGLSNTVDERGYDRIERVAKSLRLPRIAS